MNKKLNTTSSIFNKYTGRMLVGLLVVFLSGFFVTTTNATDTTGMLISPNGGENLSGIQTIKWKTDNCATGDKVNLILGYGGGVTTPNSTKTLVTGLDCSLGDYSSWDTDDSTIGDRNDFVVEIERVDSIGNTQETDFSDDFFTIDNTAPTFPATPSTDKGVDAGPVQTDTINVTVDASVSGLASTRYGFSSNETCDGSNDWTSSETGIFTSGDNFDIAGDHTDFLCVRATDKAGNIGYKEVGQLNTDNTEPTVTGVVGTTIQGADDTIAITFSESVSPSTDWGAAIDNIDSPSGTTVDLTGATYSYDSNTNILTITLDETNAHLKNGNYVVVDLATTDISDYAGNNLSSSPVTSTDTVTGDVVQPNVDITYDNNGPVKNTDIVAITATFDEALDPLVTPTISITVPGTGDISAVTMTGSGNVWTYNWTVTNGGDGTATITIDAEDLAGNADPVESNNTIEVDNTAPTVESSYLLDDNTADAFFNSTTDEVKIEITADEPVKYTRIYICEVSDSDCNDTTAIKWFTEIGSYDVYTTKDWDGNDKLSVQVLDGEYKVKVNFEDEAGNTSTETLAPYDIFVDTQVPDISDFDKPVADTVYRTDPVLDFTPGDLSGLGTLTCSYSLDGGADIPVSTCTSGTATGATETITGLTDGRHSVDVTVTDQAGNTVTSSPVSFVYDTDKVLTVGITPAQDFDVIQDAIDAWVSGITTVQVAAGTYDEQVVINKSLTLQGAGDTTIIKPSQATATGFQLFGRGVTATNDTAPVIGVDTSGGTVTIKDLKIDGSFVTSIPTPASLFTGIFYRDTNGVIDNVEINNINIKSGNGMYLVGHNTLVTIEVKNNTISGYGKNGITANYPDITANIHDNTITGMGPTDSIAQNGIQIGFGATGEIKNNTISNNVWTGIYDTATDNNPATDIEADGAAGILLYQSTGNVEVSGNILTGNQFGIWTVGSTAVNIHDNNITGLAYTGNAYPVGITVWSDDQWGGSNTEVGTTGSVLGNTISNNDYGILIRDYTTGGVAPSIVADYNNIDDSIIYGSWSNVSFNAEKNWWGDATGPKHLVANPNGNGTNVSDNIDFSPFCTDVPVYDSGTWSCNLASVDPIDYFVLSFDINPQMVNQTSILTVTARDALGYLVVNDSSTPVGISGDSGASFGTLVITMEVDGDTTTTVTNDVAGLVNVKATEAGDTAVFGTGTIEFLNSDTVGPTAEAQYPADDSTEISINVVPYLEFDEPLKASTVNSTNIQLRKYDGDLEVPAEVALVEGEQRVTITPDSPLDYETQYYIYALPAVTDTTGNALQTDYDESERDNHNFTTMADTGDYDAPTVTLVNPEDDATDVPVDSNVTITFNEALDATTVDALSVQLLDASGNLVSATLLMSDGNTKVMIMPNSNFAYDTTYHVDVTSLVTDVAGNPFAETITVTTFTTVTAPVVDTTAPEVASTNPGTGSTGVSITIRPTVTFDDVLDVTTISSSYVTLVKNSDSSLVSAVVALVEGGKTIEITPDTNLENGTEYHIEITSDVKNETGLSFVGDTDVTTFTTETITPFTVDSVEAIASSATANGKYLDGWHYVYHLTVNSGETDMRVQFSDWANSDGSSADILANNNMRALFNIATGGGMGSVVGLTETNITDGFGDVASFEIGNAYADQTGVMVITSEMDTNLALSGVQIQFDIFTKLPTGTAPGLYTTTYGIEITK